MNLTRSMLIIFVIFMHASMIAIDRMVIMIVVDGLAFKTLQQLKPYYSGGLKTLLEHSTCYDEAYYHYACTSTGPGHATLVTGCWPTTHGIVDNIWYDAQGTKVPCVSDTDPAAAIFSPTGIYPYGSSAHFLEADAISDQLMLDSTPQHPAVALSVSLKNRAAVLLGGHTGKSFWFDDKAGQFTSSKKYFDALPAWLLAFNEDHASPIKTTRWDLRFKADHPAYNHAIKNYTYTERPSLIGTTIAIDPQQKLPFADYESFPQSNKLILDCAQNALTQAYTQNPDKLFLGISLSSLDHIGHAFGPDSIEYIDTLLHIDAYLNDFLNALKKTIPSNQILICFTADHGNFSIVENMHNKGFRLAHRLEREKIKVKLNARIKKIWNLEDVIVHIDEPSIYLRTAMLETFAPKKRTDILNFIKTVFKKLRGVRNIWTYDELVALPAQPGDFTTYYKNQLYPNRSGLLQYQLNPYSIMAKDKRGTAHSSPYNYSTHVPLFFYQPTENKTTGNHVQTKTPMTAVAPTITNFFGIEKPSACIETGLPLA